MKECTWYKTDVSESQSRLTSPWLEAVTSAFAYTGPLTALYGHHRALSNQSEIVIIFTPKNTFVLLIRWIFHTRGGAWLVGGFESCSNDLVTRSVATESVIEFYLHLKMT